jgi:hypothetical protein
MGGETSVVGGDGDDNDNKPDGRSWVFLLLMGARARPGVLVELVGGVMGVDVAATFFWANLKSSFGVESGKGTVFPQA